MENSFVPNGILTLATHLKCAFPDMDIKIADGSILSLHEIAEIINDFCPQVVGLSVLLGNYINAKPLLRQAKSLGAKTILGNHHAAYIRQLLVNNPSFQINDVDYIIDCVRAESVFVDLIKALKSKLPVSSIPQLGHKDNGVFSFNEDRPAKSPHLKRILPDITFVEKWERYFLTYNEIFGAFHSNKNVKPININYIEGCYSGCKEPCIYCCLRDHAINFVEPEKYWERIRTFISMGFNYFFETCNSLSSMQFVKYKNTTFLNYLSNSIPDDIKDQFQMMVYARADEINDEVLSAFKKMNVHRVIFGFDSADSDVLGKGILKHGNTKVRNIDIAANLDANNIQIYACYVPGSSAESPETLEKTYQEILELLKLRNTCVIEFTALAPMPGSLAWIDIKDEYEQRYGISDVIDVNKLSRTWVENMVPGVTWELIQDYKHKIKDATINEGRIFGGYY